MAHRGNGRDLTEAFQDFLQVAARALLVVSSVATLLSLGVLVFLCFRVAGDPAIAQDALKNIVLFEKVLMVGVVGLAVATSYMFWGEELLGALQLMGAAAMFFAPMYLPLMLGGSTTPNATIARSMGAIQSGGSLLGVVALLVLVIDLSQRAKNRVKVGTKADQLKFGKGIKEDPDKQNVFMGKCWQLPYCRKFVRERCPIFHAKRTCWREQTGCMCEEEVIRGAMENKPIPKDMVLAAKYIPHNHRLTGAEKRERCRSCVIYNEHQRHKYKAALPLTLLAFVVIYLAFHGPLYGLTEGVVGKINTAAQAVTLDRNGKVLDTPPIFIEALLFAGLLVALAYALKMLEYLVFKLKI